MIDYAFSKNKLIGMVQNKNDSELYNVGCVGKITSFNETDDGRYIVNLLGKSIFTITKEIKSDYKFRIVESVFTYSESLYEKKINIDLNKKKLLSNRYQEFLIYNNSKIELDFVDKISSSDLIKFIAMTSPFSKEDKQMLLETYSLDKLLENIFTLFDYYMNIDKNNTSIN
jgi:Lon protease-like protein